MEHTVDCRPSLTSSPSKNTVSSLFVPYCSPTHGSTPVAPCPCRIASPMPSSSSSLSHYGEPLSVNPVPNETPGARLPPRQHLPRRLATGWPKSAGGAAPTKGGDFPVLQLTGQKAETGRATSSAGWAVSLLSLPNATMLFFFFQSN
jgi:hypothetical protein